MTLPEFLVKTKGGLRRWLVEKEKRKNVGAKESEEKNMPRVKDTIEYDETLPEIVCDTEEVFEEKEEDIA